MYRSWIMRGFSKLWAAVLLSLMIAATPSMAAHMGIGYSHDAPDTLQIEQEQVGSPTSDADQGEIVADCQDVCCSGTCASGNLTGESEHSLNVPRMQHSGTTVVENFSARVASLLRPPKL
jgi:hypothetical protein